MNIDKAKGTFDWFLSKKQINQVVILLVIIIGLLGAFSYTLKTDINKLQIKVNKQDSIINILKLENQALKYQGLLLLNAYEDDPNPRWITDAITHEVKSVNQAYEDVHLKPLGYTRFDLIGTTGEAIFGDIVNDKFIPDNELVLKLGRPVTFDKEINTTVKYPIGKNGYFYAVMGYEYLNHN